jgi:outer membrane receptor protein involved in Fe transport
MVYTSVAKGFRPGGGNPPVSGICAGDLAALGLKEAPSSYKSDSVWSYEVGTKGRPLNGRLDIDGSAYYIKWSAIQQEVPLPCGFGYTANNGQAVSKGFDLHVGVSVFSNLTLGMSVGYDDAYYAKTIPLPGSNQLNLVTAGDRLNTAPWKALATVDYSFTPRAEFLAYVHADYAYSNGYNYSTNGQTLGGPIDVSYDPQDHQVFAQRIASARLGVKHDSWDVSLFVKNLFNSTDLLYTTHQPVPSQLFEDETFRPRTIGLTASLKF